MSQMLQHALKYTAQEFCEHSEWSRPEALQRYREVHRAGQHVDAVAPVTHLIDSDGTSKFVVRLSDGLETESVILPYQGSSGRQRRTLCVSSQVGCAMGCTFCETAQMGLMRNLAPAEIVQQWFVARHALDQPIDNIVFMGMGEPLDNLDSVLQAIRILTDRNGPAIAPARITVSTVGRVAGIERLAQFANAAGRKKLKLAVSVNAPNDTIRSQIMPINRAESMADLRRAMVTWGRRVLVEYVVIPGANHSDEHAWELSGWLADLDCTVNVIPYNPRRDSPWPAPDEATVDRFIRQLATSGVRVRRRQTKGRPTFAACGQLGNEHIRRRKWVLLTAGRA